MVIYRLTCNNCQQFYISSTTQKSHVRCKENSANHQSPMYNCGEHGFKTVIIGEDIDAVNQHFMKPNATMNNNHEQLDYRHFLYY